VAYDAFISYSHQGSATVAPALRTGLERLARKWTSRRALNVFLDESDLSATPSLWGTITAALDEARYLVVLGSRAAVSSEWVGKEIDYFTARHGAEHVIVALLDGSCEWDDATGAFSTTRASAIPAALRAAITQEPLWVDLSWVSDDMTLDLHNPRFRACVAEIAAPIHGVPLDELDAADLREHRRQRRARAIATTGLALLAVLATVGGVVAVKNSRRADANAATAVHNADVAAQNAKLAGQNAATAKTNEDKAVAASTLADARRLAAQSELLAGEHTDLAALLSLESLRLKPGTSDGTESLARVMTEPISATTIDTGTTTTSVAADGGTILTAYADGSVSKQSGSTRVDGAFGRGLSGPVALALSNDGTTLLERSDTDLQVVRLAPTGARVLFRSSAAPSGCKVKPAIDARGDRMAVATRDGIAVFGAHGTGRRIPLGLVPTPSLCDLGTSVAAVAISADGSRIAAAYGYPSSVSVWRTSDSVLLSSFTSPDVVRAVAFSRDGRFLLSGGESGLLRRWDIALGVDGEPLPAAIECSLANCAGDNWIFDLVVSPDGRRVIAATGSGVRVWAIARNGSAVKEVPPVALAGSKQLDQVTWDGSDVVLGRASDEHVLHRWEFQLPHVVQANAHSQATFVMAATRRDAQVASGAMDGSIVVHDVKKGTNVHLVQPNFIVGMAFDPSGRYLVAASWGPPPTLRMWDLQADPATFVDLHITDVFGVSFLPDGSLVVSIVDGNLLGVSAKVSGGGGTGRVEIWNVHSVKKLATIFEGDPALALATSADGSKIGFTTVGDGGTLQDGVAHFGHVFVVDRSGRSVTRQLRSTSILPLGIAFSPDGRRLASAGENGVVEIFDLADGGRAVEASGHLGLVAGLAFSSDNSVLVSTGAGDATIRFWDSTTGAPLGEPLDVNELSNTSNSVFGVVIAKDTIWIGAGDGGLSIRRRMPDIKVGTHGDVLELPSPDTWKRQACERAGRNLAADEWKTYISSTTPPQFICPAYPIVSGSGSPG
jgi:WD40 repeat protein